MERVNITRTWGIAAIIILAIIGLVVAFLLVSSPVRMQAASPGGPAITVQWRDQSILESKFLARVIDDNDKIMGAFGKRLKPEEAFKGTYLQKLRIWEDETRTWISGASAYEKLAKILGDKGPQSLSIDSISIVIDYQPYAGAPTVETDVDAIATVRITFSASPGGNIAEGELLHRRICPII